MFSGVGNSVITVVAVVMGGRLLHGEVLRRRVGDGGASGKRRRDVAADIVRGWTSVIGGGVGEREIQTARDGRMFGRRRPE